MLRPLLSALLFLLFAPAINSQNPVIATRLEGEIVFDGTPSEEEWRSVTPLPTYMYQPDPGGTPTEKTEILIAYTSTHLWIGGRFYDRTPELIRGNTRKRDDYGDDNDFFGIMIDGLNGNETGFIFSTTPQATRLDLVIFNDGKDEMPFNSSWNTYWDVRTSVTDQGWFMEMRIPFSSLRFREQNGEVTMGISAYRWIPHKNEMITFPSIDPRHGQWAKQRPSLAHDVVFSGIEQRNPAYITPYLVAGSYNQWDLNSEGTAYDRITTPALEPGVDIKYSINNNLTLDVTVNTDFAQVENDDQQVNMSRFSLFFPEKRQFFQERSDIFDFSLGRDAQAFYSRRIGLNDGEKVRILGGARLTGKAGEWDLGIIDMQTAASDMLPSENFGVLRMKRPVFNPYSYAGGIITSRVGTDGSYNFLYGLDSYIKVFGDDYLDIKLSGVHDSGIGGSTPADRSFVRINWDRRTEEGLSYRASFNWSGEDYQPGMGFMRRYNYFVTGGRLRYGWIPGHGSPLFSHQAYLKGVSYFSTTGDLETLILGPGYTFVTKNKVAGELELEYQVENLPEPFELSDEVAVPEGSYSFVSVKGKLDSPDSYRFNVRSEFEAGGFYDGSRFSLKLKPAWSVSPSLKVEGQYQIDRARFDLRSDTFINHLGQLKLTAMFSTRLSLSAFIQYNSAIDAFLSNLRFRYNPREGNDFYIVYNEGRNYHPDRELPELPQFSERTILLKYTYTFAL